MDAAPEPLRVAHLVQYLSLGGLERMAAALAEDAPQHGIDATLVAYLGADGFQASLARRGVRAIVLPTAEGIRPSLSFRLARWLRDARIDVLHTHHVGPFVYGSIAAAMCGAAHVHTEHSHELYDRPRRRMIGAAMPRLARAVAVTPEVAAFHRDELGTELEVVPNGVAIPRSGIGIEARVVARDAMRVPDGRRVVGCIARLAPEKGHRTLLEAFAAHCPDAHLVLVGAGPEDAAIRAAAAALRISERVTLTGAVDAPERLLPGLDVVALASTREGQPLALLEAMARGVPVVATAVGGVPDVLAGGAGVLVRPGDVAALGEALATLLRDGALRARVGAAGRARVVAHHSVERMSARYAALYREEIARRSGRCASPT